MCDPTRDWHTVLGGRPTLQLQSMPDLLRNLDSTENKRNNKSGPRDIVATESRYSPSVLVGNWFDERNNYEKNYLPPKVHFRSIYTSDYQEPLPPGKRDLESYYDNYFHGEGKGHDFMFKYGGDEFEGNFSTTYDLAFNESLKDPDKKLRTYSRRLKILTPQQDLAENFGNVSNYGLNEYYKKVWECEKENEFIKISETIDKFRAPHLEDLVTGHFAVPKDLSSAILTSNAQNKDVRLRGTPINVVTSVNTRVVKPSNACIEKQYDRTMAGRRLRKFY